MVMSLLGEKWLVCMFVCLVFVLVLFGDIVNEGIQLIKMVDIDGVIGLVGLQFGLFEEIDEELIVCFECDVIFLLDQLYGGVLWMMCNLVDVEDLFQEMMVKVYVGFCLFWYGINFKVWFYWILINIYINSYCKKQW